MNRVLIIRIDRLIHHFNGYIGRSYPFGKVKLERLFLGLHGLNARVSDIRNLPLRAVLHLGVAAVRCLRVIMSFLFAFNGLPILVLIACGHYHDHSVMGRSTIGDSMARVRRQFCADHDLGDICAGFSQPLVAKRFNIKGECLGIKLGCLLVIVKVRGD